VYIKPQVKVFQEFAAAPQAVVQNLNAFVFGPHYQLFRYTEASEKALVSLGAYNKDSNITYNWPNKPAFSVVDNSFTKLYSDDTLLKYISFAESAVNPIVLTDGQVRNKLRAAPRLGNTTSAGNIDVTASGVHNGGSALPASYYLYPASNFIIGSAVGSLNYVTSTGQKGSVDVPADATVADKVVSGPDGVALDFDTTGLGVVTPREVTISGASSSFSLKQLPNRIPSHIADAEASNALRVTVADAALAITYNPGVSNELSISVDITGGTNSVAAVRAAIVAVTDILEDWEVTSIEGDGLDPVTDIEDQDTNDLVGATTEIIPDYAFYTVFANAITFKTANGFTRSANLFKDVEIGDRIRYVVTPVETGVPVTTFSTVRGFEADVVNSSVSESIVADDNAETQLGTDLSAGDSSVINPNDDNQNTGLLFGASAAVYLLDQTSTYDYAFGDQSSGVKELDITVTITKGGLATSGNVTATVTNASGTYSRTGVPVVADANYPDGSIYIGSNMVLAFDATGDTSGPGGTPDRVFKAGDSYNITGVATPVRAVDNLIVSGTYIGQQDTTYRLEVVRGGLFDRTVVTQPDINYLARKHNAVYSNSVITFSGNPSDGQTVTLDDGFNSVVFEFDNNASVTGTNTAVTIGGSQAATVANLLAAIQSSVLDATAVETTAGSVITVTLKNLANSITSGDTSGVIATADTAVSTPNAADTITAAVDISQWSGGDVDDEYRLTVTKAGNNLVSTEFELTSNLGDNQSGISFPGYDVAVAVGIKRLSITLSDVGTVNPSFAVGESIILNLRLSRPKLKITDSAGVDQQTNTVVADGDVINVGLNGVTVTFPANTNSNGGIDINGGLTLGDIWTIEAKAKAQGPVKTLVLGEPIVATVAAGVDTLGVPEPAPDLFAVDLFLFSNSVEIPAEQRDTNIAPGSYNWQGVAANLTVNSGITLQDSRWVDPNDGSMPYLEMWQGNLYVEYRALLKDYADTIYSISNIDDVVGELGPITTDNPLALGVYKALLNSADSSVYFMAVPSDDVTGYSKVLGRATLSDKVYGLVPLTFDSSIHELVDAHVDAMSSETRKRWRIALFALQSRTEIPVLWTGNHPSNGLWNATLKADTRLPGSVYTKVEFTEFAELLDRVAVGDEIRFNFDLDAWGNETYTSSLVAEIESNQVLYLETAQPAAINTAVKMEIHHALSTPEQATDIAERSAAFADRRVYSIFPDTLFNEGVAEEGFFAAAAIAGLIGSVVPQQGITNTELVGFDDIPAVYSNFNEDELDVIAGGGTMIVAQEYPGGTVFIRHQISTNYREGVLAKSELSMVKNYDSISYYFANKLAPFIGQYNVTPALIDHLRTEVQAGINFLSSFTSVGLLGPQVIKSGSEITLIQQHPTLLDHVIINLKLNLPAPLNVIELHLVV